MRREHPKYPGYLVCDSGHVYSLKRPTVMQIAERIRDDGYVVVSVRSANGKSKTRLIHRLVAETFIQKFIQSDSHLDIQVNHKSGDKSDNSVANLEWVTPSQNQRHRHSVLKKRCAIGSLSGSSKLTKRQIFAIRLGLKIGRRGIGTKLALRFGISAANITAIKQKRSWDFI